MGSDDLFWTKKRGKLERKSHQKKKYRDSILIICEGEKTEPNYFNAFPTSNVVVKTIGTGMNTSSLVENAVDKWKEYATEGKYFEYLWCVFDRDSFTFEQYNKAFKSIASLKKKINQKFKNQLDRSIAIEVAHSNEAFELWYLLHFDFIDTGIPRTRYQKMLSSRLGERYKKNDPSIYKKLERLAKETNGKQGQSFAISNAKKLKIGISKRELHKHNPSTNVDLLVEMLNIHLKN